ncbi:hypothetical protein ACIB24_01730 [Spongisporangium articulatum]|uniref:SalK n=1 Tax=Spongisporangium articulatum TaxID=3362603 RepID=A0ABW8AHE7_9ACTN
MVHTEHAPSPLAQAGRAAWAALEPLHNYMYFVPYAAQLYATEGVTDPRDAYFAARASVVGHLGPTPVTAMFYNFAPASVSRSIPRVWTLISPERAREVRAQAVEEALTEVLGESADSPQLHEALALARRAAEAATEHAQGRPLFSAHAELPWPESPHAQLWHAQTLLREFRGDGHTATLLHSGVSGLEALVLYTATEKVDGDQLRLTRGVNRNDWDACVASLVDQGLLEPDTRWDVTPAGAALRKKIEDTTDVLAEVAYAPLGVAGAQRLAELSTALNKPVVEADVIPWLRKRPIVTRRSRVRGRTVSLGGNLESRSAV